MPWCWRWWYMFCIFSEWVLDDEENFVCVLNYGKKSAFLFYYCGALGWVGLVEI